jgi:hypothetical protein
MNKEHLVNLLYYSIKQYSFFGQLRKIGMEVYVDSDIYNIVCDIIGLPKDNSAQYNLSGNEPKLKTPDDALYCRDYITDTFFEITEYAEENYNVSVKIGSIEFDQGIAEQDIKNRIEKFIDIIYEEKNNLPN